MTCLITGATGFIGRKLVAQLLARGDAVHYLGRKRSENLPSQASFHPWTTLEPPELGVLPRLDAVFNLAGEPVAQRWTESVKRRIYDSRIGGTRNLVQALTALRYKPSVLVNASAVGYYGDRGDEVLSESSPPGSDFLANVCIAWEAEAARARALGIRVLPVRIATVLGEGGALQKMLPPFRVGLGAKFGNGRQWMSWVEVNDLVRLFLFAADTDGLNGPLNGSSPQPVSNSSFTAELAKTLHRPALLAIPRFALGLLLGEMSSFLFSSLRVVPKAAENAGFTFQYPDLDGALRSILMPH